jgi:hypothetical protein
MIWTRRIRLGMSTTSTSASEPLAGWRFSQPWGRIAAQRRRIADAVGKSTSPGEPREGDNVEVNVDKIFCRSRAAPAVHIILAASDETISEFID